MSLPLLKEPLGRNEEFKFVYRNFVVGFDGTFLIIHAPSCLVSFAPTIRIRSKEGASLKEMMQEVKKEIDADVPSGISYNSNWSPQQNQDYQKWYTVDGANLIPPPYDLPDVIE